MKQTSYEILTNRDARELAAEVRDYINRGWQAHGSLVVSGFPTGFFYVQAVVNLAPDQSPAAGVALHPDARPELSCNACLQGDFYGTHDENCVLSPDSATVPFTAGGPNPDRVFCNRNLAAQGKAYPRTCAVCKLGACRFNEFRPIASA